MAHELEPLILDLVEWVAQQPRPYTDVMEAWRTSCPRLPVWEDAVDRGLVVREHSKTGGTLVCVSDAGLRLLEAHGRLTKQTGFAKAG